jgi:KDO2-lipid IV(A) lauroyltransferase
MLYAIIVAIGGIVRRVPLAAARAFGGALGHLAWHVLIRERRKAIANLTIAFPDWTSRARRATTRRMFHHLGVSMMEILWLPNVDATNLPRTTTMDGIERLEKLVRDGHGVVVFACHCGNWEWLVYATALRCPSIAVLQRERNETELNRFIVETRARAGVHTIDRGSLGAGREMIQALRNGGVLAFLIDQNIRTESVKVPFFGVPALTPIGPAKLAIRSESYIINGFIERSGGNQHIRFSEAVKTRRGDDPVALTARITADIEAQIRRRPEEWVWFHERWRERPRYDVTGDW